MDNSKTVSVRLSNDVVNEIERFQEKYNIKSKSDFFHVSAALCISITETIVRMVKSPELTNDLEKFQRDLMDIFEKLPATKEKFKLYEKSIIPKFEDEIHKGSKYVEPFAQKRSAGRPSKPKFSRGRPKEQEYGK